MNDFKDKTILVVTQRLSSVVDYDNIIFIDDGKVHSYAFNDHFGDYGATIIMQYQLDDLVLYALYGHLSLASLHDLQEGKEIGGGEQFATFGEPSENGHWPPHLHFQLILDIKDFHGDYPGVCRYSEKERFLLNSPDPQYILKSTFGDLV